MDRYSVEDEIMSQRQILKTLNKVEPTKTILIKSFPCEYQAAYIRNQAIESMDNDDIEGVVYRYFQSKQGENYTFSKARFWGSVTSGSLAVSLYIYNAASSENNDSNTTNMILNCFLGFVLIVSLFPFTYCLINMNNSRRYKETKEDCEAWLKDKIDMDALEKFKTSGSFYFLPDISTFLIKNPDNRFEEHKSKLRLT